MTSASGDVVPSRRFQGSDMQIQASVFPDLRHCYSGGSGRSADFTDMCLRVRSRLTSDDCTADTTAIFGMVGHDVTGSPNLIRGGKQERRKNHRSESDKKVTSMPSPAFVSKDVLKTFMYPICEARIFLFRGKELVVLFGKRGNGAQIRGSHTLYRLPSAPTEHPSSRYPIFFTIAAIPHELSRAARRPISLARARKNCRSASVVSRAKKWVNMPMIMRSSSVGSLPRNEPMSRS